MDKVKPKVVDVKERTTTLEEGQAQEGLRATLLDAPATGRQ